MSLVIRRVKEISKKKSRKSRKWYILEPFDDNPSKLLIDEEYGEEQDSLPSLNSVYKKTIVGTPILFRRISGWEYQDHQSYNVNFQSITFMKEYHKKSFEELRWEDYLSNRKGNHYIQETNFPRIVTNYNFSISDNFEFFHPLPRNILKHLDLGRVLGPHPNEISFSNKNKMQNLFAGKTAENTPKNLFKNKDFSKKFDTFNKNSETNFWHLEQAKMSKEKIMSFFSKSGDLVSSSCSVSNILFFPPSGNSDVNLIKPRRKKNVVENPPPNNCGDFYLEKDIEVKKYADNYISKEYLNAMTHPYLQYENHCFKNNRTSNSGQVIFTRCKNHILGRNITSFDQFLS